jgi:hypothetical protein
MGDSLNENRKRKKENFVVCLWRFITFWPLFSDDDEIAQLYTDTLCTIVIIRLADKLETGNRIAKKKKN